VLFLVSIWWLMTYSDYEDRLFRWFVSETVSASMGEEERALALMHRTHSLVAPNAAVFAQRPRQSFRGRFLMSADGMLLEGYSWCGAFSHVLARAMREADFDVRIAQMRVGEEWGAHIVVEAKVDGAWIVLDPSYDHAFRRPDGHLAGIAEIHEDWDAYKSQVPAGYNPAYDYGDVRYANWERIPVAGHVAETLLSAAFGEEPVRTFSPRVYMLNMYGLAARVLTVLYLALVSIPSLVWLIRRGLTRSRPLATPLVPNH
jgi:transglutaminase-like putative cysteine protease